MALKKKESEVETQKATKASRELTLAERAKGGASHVTGHVSGFADFVRTQGVVGLAVGLAIGAAAGDTVKRIVEGFINPIVQFIVGTESQLETATWTFEAWGRSAEFAWGAALSSAITLLATALVIYWFVRIFKLDRLDKKKS